MAEQMRLGICSGPKPLAIGDAPRKALCSTISYFCLLQTVGYSGVPAIATVIQTMDPCSVLKTGRELLPRRHDRSFLQSVLRGNLKSDTDCPAKPGTPNVSF
jgi:hypothetical protein